ncbi:hypothetical protein ACWGXJ_25895 [Paenibacillus sp. S33]
MESHICIQMCPSKNKTGECSLERDRVGLSAAHVIVTNHAYFFNDLVLRKKTGNGNLPTYDAVIFDEAHEIEDVCCKAFEKKVDIQQFETLFNQFFNHDQVQRLGVESRLKLNDMHLSFQRKIEDLYEGISQYMSHNHGNQAGFHLMYSRIAVEEICKALGDFIKTVKEMKIKSISEILERLFEANDNLDFIGQVEKRSWAYWVTTDQYGKIVLHAAPLFPKVVLAYGLFDKVTVILASATIATGDNFNVWNFVVERKSLYPEVLVLDDKEEVVIHASNGWIDYPKRWSVLDLEHTFLKNIKREFDANEFLNAAQGLGFLLDGNVPQSIQEVDSLIMSLYVD